MSLDAMRKRTALLQLARFGKLDTRHLEALIFDGSGLAPHSREVTMWRMLQQLREAGLVSAIHRPVSRAGGGSARPIYQLSETGCRHLARTDPALHWVRRPRRGAESIEHLLMAADLYVAFVRAARRNPGHEVGDWEPDRRAVELLGSSRLVPDGYLVYRTGEWQVDAFVEIDLATESPSTFGSKVAQYIAALRRGTWRMQLPRWPVVLTVTPGAARAGSLRRVTESVLRRERDAERLAEVAEFDFASIFDLLGPSGPLGCIWQIAGREGLHPLIPAEFEPDPPEASALRQDERNETLKNLRDDDELTRRTDHPASDGRPT